MSLGAPEIIIIILIIVVLFGAAWAYKNAKRSKRPASGGVNTPVERRNDTPHI